MKPVDVPSIFKADAADLIQCRERALKLHETNIRAGGDEVETCVRDWLRRMLPTRYHVAQGHLIDSATNASSQLDIIISDNFNVPSLQTTRDGTVYIPIDSVYAVGEVKSTYYRKNRPIEAFAMVVQDIRRNLHHEDLLNTAYEDRLDDDTLVRDMALSKGNKVLNRIFFFAVFVEAGDLEFSDVASFYAKSAPQDLPDMTVILNRGIILRAAMNDKFYVNRYPEDPKHEDEHWCLCPFVGVENSTLEGNDLGYLYYTLVEHLANSYLEPPSLAGYLRQLQIGRKSKLEWADEANK